jgi:hypothetical protein
MSVRLVALVTILCLSGTPLGAQSAAQSEPAEPSQGQPEPKATDPPPKPWYERIRISGDFRSRYEGFYQEDRTNRHRVRLRLRLRLDTAVNQDMRFQLQVASGDPGTPVSTNQTFTGFFLPKPIAIDRAFMAYNPRAAPALTIGAGKFPAPQNRTQMVFDEDLNFEGGWEQVAWKATDRVGVRLVGLQTAVNEISGASDAYMLGGFGELSFTAGRRTFRASVANYAWGNEDQIAVASAGGPLESILTNRLTRNPGGAVTGYLSEFNVVDVIGEAVFQTPREGYPLRLLADYAFNTRAATDRDRGLWIEAEYGEPRGPGTWSAGYTYGWVEEDVTPSAFVFSDMPGTNTRLHMLDYSYVPLSGVSVDVTLHVTKRLFLDRPTDPNTWLYRVHAGATVRF